MIHTLAKEKSTTSVTSGKSAPTPDLRLPLPSRVGSANPIKERRARQNRSMPPVLLTFPVHGIGSIKMEFKSRAF